MSLHQTKAPIEKALVIHPVRNSHDNIHIPQLRLEEAIGLTIALGLEVANAKIEIMREIRPSTYFGTGKIEAIDELAQEFDVKILIIDDEISPIQQRNLEKRLNLKVIDRTGLILEIFSLRARTKEGKLQVELARLSYEKSRLVRTWTHLERQRGGTSKTGGPGERQIELDRRLIAERIIKLKAELEQVRRTRTLQRAGREKVPFPIVALVGYTNSGKSTLFNQATNAKVLAKDMLFATLDTTSRQFKTPAGIQIILTDTVGFITDLPHQLIAAFRATLEEVALADVLIHVRDIASDESEGQKHDVDAILDKIFEKYDTIPPIIEAWNKSDLLAPNEANLLLAKSQANFMRDGEVSVLLSAQTGEGINDLFEQIDKELTLGSIEKWFLINSEDGKMRAYLYQKGTVIAEKLDKKGQVAVQTRMSASQIAQFASRFPNYTELSGSSLKKFNLKP